jgi:glycosyltransferase involved in cell wall biosynthesis
MEYPLVTISIPVFTTEKYIERCINSVLQQTYPNTEILLIDDHSSDNSLEIINRIQSQYPDKISIISFSENKGPSAARNSGIDNAKGKYLFFLDADDEITSDCIEKLYKRAYETDATLTVAQATAKNTFNNTQYEIFTFKKELEYLEGNDIILNSFCKGDWSITCWNKLFKIDFFKENKIYFVEGIFSQDELWSFHYALKLDSIAFLNESTYWYYLHGESIIFNKTKRNFENHQTIVEYFSKAYREETPNRKKFILNHIVTFKELTLSMQWKVMKDDINYWKYNYNRLKKAPSLSMPDYFSSFYPPDIKRKNFFQNLPVGIGYKLFKWRFERK